MKKTTLTTILLLSALLLTGCNSNNNVETTTTANINVAEDNYITEAAETTSETTEVITTEEPHISDSDVPFMEFDPAYSVTIDKNISDNVKITMKLEPLNIKENKPEAAVLTFNNNTTYKDISTIYGYELIPSDETFSVDCNKDYLVGYDKENKKDITKHLDIKYNGFSFLFKNYQTKINKDGTEGEPLKPVFSIEAYNENGLITNPAELENNSKIKAICANVDNIYAKTDKQASYIIPSISFTAEDGKECSFTIGGFWNVDKELEKAGICENRKDVRFKINKENDYVIVKNTDYTVVFHKNLNDYINSITLINN